MKWMDRWAARAQRFADRRDERYRQHQDAVRAGTIPPTLMDRATAPTPQLAQAEHERFQQLCDLIELLSSGPVSGPDGIPVRICLIENNVRAVFTRRPPEDSMPKPWLRAIATERTATGRAAAILVSGCEPRFVYAYAISGPPHQLMHDVSVPYQLQIRSAAYYSWFFEAARYALALAQDVRSRGVNALPRI